MTETASTALALAPVATAGALAAVAGISHAAADVRWALLLTAAAVAGFGFPTSAGPTGLAFCVAALAIGALALSSVMTRIWLAAPIAFGCAGIAVAAALASHWLPESQAAAVVLGGSLAPILAAGFVLVRARTQRQTKGHRWLWGHVVTTFAAAAIFASSVLGVAVATQHIALGFVGIAAILCAAAADREALIHLRNARDATLFAAILLGTAITGSMASEIDSLALRTMAGGLLGAFAVVLASYLEGLAHTDAQASSERFVVACRQQLAMSHDFSTLSAALLELASTVGLREIRLLRTDGRGWASLDGEREPTGDIDSRAALWLGVNPEPRRQSDLSGPLLGGLREPVTATFRALGAQVLVPLVHQDSLVGAIAAGSFDSRRWRQAAGALNRIRGAAADKLHALVLQSTVDRQAVVAEEVMKVEERRAKASGDFEDSGAKAHFVYIPGAALSGDFWVIEPLKNGNVLFAVGSVAGTGTGSSLLAAAATGALQAVIAMPRLQDDPSGLLRHVDTTLAGLGTQQHPISSFVLLWRPKSSDLHFANAGHPFPYRLSPGQPPRLGVLAARGNRLGLAGAFRAPNHRKEARPSERLILGSEGLWSLTREPRELHRKIVELAGEKDLAGALLSELHVTAQHDVTCVVIDLP